MMFYKPLVSLVVALATASSVAASATPVVRGDYPPPSPSPTSSCDAANTYCCNTWTNSQNPALGVIGILLSLLNGNLIDGLDCTSLLSGGTW